MKALTVRQPWASLIADGTKVYETRSWPPPKTLIGERIAIHAGKQCDHRAADGFGYAPYDMELGVLVCTARIVAAHYLWGDQHHGVIQSSTRSLSRDADPDFGCQMYGAIPIDAYGDYAPGRWAWRLVDVDPLDPPVPARGRHGLWNWVYR